MISYSIQFCVFLGLFWVVYEAFLKKETFFNYNRLYLLVTPILAVVMPFLEIQFFKEKIGNAIFFKELPTVLLDGNTQPNSDTLFNSLLLLEIIYVTGVIVSLSLLLRKFYRLYQLKKSAIKTGSKNLPIWEVKNSKMACTFFNQIFLGKNLSEEEKEQILLHEKVHLEQKHTYDLVFFEFLKIIFWFNPFIYRYQALLKSLHEYIADREAVSKTSKATYYERLLNVAFDTQKISFINQFFNHSLIKKRILMLQKSRSNRTAKLKYLLLVPLLLSMIMYVSCSDQGPKGTESNQEIAPPPPPPPPPPAPNSTMAQNYNMTEVDQFPAYPGCENEDTPDEIYQCSTQKINEFVNKHFNIKGVENVAETGNNKIYVRFVIGKDGAVKEVKSRARKPELEKEAERVIKSLPTMKPALLNGEPVDIAYALPIIFKINE